MSGFVTLQELALGAQTRPIDTKQRKWDCWCLEAVVAIARRYHVILTGTEVQEIYKKSLEKLLPNSCFSRKNSSSTSSHYEKSRVQALCS